MQKAHVFCGILMVLLAAGAVSVAASGEPSVLEKVQWLYADHFTAYAVDQFPEPNWTTLVAERKATWTVVAFPQAEQGFALRGHNVGYNPNRAILLVDVPQTNKGKIVVATRIWLDEAGLPGIDLFDTKHSWPNYMSVHPWNLGKFASGTELKPYDVVAVFDLATRTTDVYVNGALFKSGLAFRAGQEPPASGVYHVGVVFNNDNDATDLYYEFIRVGVAD